MKIFIAYRFTGEDPVVLQKTMTKICQAVSAAGHETYCSIDKEEFFQAQNYTVNQIMEQALKDLDRHDALLAFVNSDNKSEGMLIEVGYALAKGKQIILAKRKGVHAHSLEGVASRLIEFEDLEDLNQQLSKLKL